MDSPNSQLHLHFPTSEDSPGLGIFISCETGFPDPKPPQRSQHGEESDSDSSSDMGGIPSLKAIIIGKLGVCFLPMTLERVDTTSQHQP